MGVERRMAIVGTGHRAVTLFGAMLADRRAKGAARLVGLCDPNALRLRAAQKAMGVNVPLYTDFDALLAESGCDTVVVTTMDETHDAYIVRALEAGCDVITEKPLTTDIDKLERIVKAERASGHHVTVTFNYRYAPYATKVREVLASGRLGTLVSINFEWYLDTVHGADYFRRWHRQIKHSGSLWVHKATHHFDLVNWWIQQDPVEVFARGTRAVYGERGRPHGERCSTCQLTESCAYAFDWHADDLFSPLYQEAESFDGYWRDGCVFSPDIDIWDTMLASVQYSGGTLMNYSLHAFMPFEGYRIAFNGTEGRLECQVMEAAIPQSTHSFAERQRLRRSPGSDGMALFPWGQDAADRLLLYPVFGGIEEISVPRTSADHGGGDERLAMDLLYPSAEDRLGHQAGTRAGALSILTGIAARESIHKATPVRIADLCDADWLDLSAGR